MIFTNDKGQNLASNSSAAPLETQNVKYNKVSLENITHVTVSLYWKLYIMFHTYGIMVGRVLWGSCWHNVLGLYAGRGPKICICKL